MAHDVYDDMFAIIVRPNKNMKHLNEEFVVKDLCKGKNYFKYNFFTLCMAQIMGCLLMKYGSYKLYF